MKANSLLRRTSSLLPGALLAAGLLLSAAPKPAAADGPPIITSVRVEAIGAVDTAAIAQVLELEVGSPLDKRRLRDVITTLYAGGEVEWLRVESTESAGGIDVLVRLSLRSTISDIKVRTKSLILRVKIRRWLQLEPRDPVTAAGIEVSRRRVERRLLDRGYADVRVEAYLNYDRKSNTVAVEFEVV
ncbi:MAG: hypothetical protein MUP13_02565, partial [Thermoanaerobaculales bacterium]|nr:hypothetical protein [Thermoanaerobaculales bacterium]